MHTDEVPSENNDTTDNIGQTPKDGELTITIPTNPLTADYQEDTQALSGYKSGRLQTDW